MSARETLKKLYHGLPLSHALKERVRAALPYALRQPNPALRQYGTVQDIYPWRVDDELDTRAYVQNFFSVFYPDLDTRTSVKLWCYDESGRLVDEREQPLAARQTLAVSMLEWSKSAPGAGARGTMMWHIVMPKAVAARPECAQQHAYFTDRGYIAFLKRGTQASYMHGIDRYAVFQKAQAQRYDAFYPAAQSYEWRPELPLGPSLACARMDVMTVNRCRAPAEIELQVLDGARTPVASFTRVVPERGLFCQALDGALLAGLGDAGSLRVTGLPTPWTRVMVLRHFASGAVAAMHC